MHRNLVADFLQAVVRRLRLSDGTVLALGSVSDGQTVKRSGSSFVGYTPSTADIVGAWSRVVKASDETRNTNNTLTDDAELSFAMAANTNYLIRAHFHYDTNTTPDFKWAVTGPASPTALRFTTRNMVAGSSTLNPFSYSAYPTGEIVLGNTGTGSVIIEGFIRNGSNSGTFHIQWAQNTSNGANTSVLAGSYIEYVTF